MHILVYMNNATTKATAMRAALATGDYKAVIDLSSGEIGMEHIWASAMTAHYGPGETHATRCDAQGRPLPETLEAFPSIANAMEQARERLPYFVDRLERFGAY